MEVKCANCGAVSTLADGRIPIGRSYIVCPKCEMRINLFKSVAVGSIITNLANLRFLGDGDLNERFCEPGELWRVVDAVMPCPDRGKGRSCERDNRGRCPNQRLVVRLSHDKKIYKTCLYRNGIKIFDKPTRHSVGATPLTSGSVAIE